MRTRTLNFIGPGQKRTGLTDEQGFTLVELSIVVMIVGVLLSASLNAYQLHNSQRAFKETQDNIEMVKQALGEFIAVNGRYPCPANPNLSPADPNYGEEQCRSNITDPCPVGLPAGLVCTNSGSRDADNNGTNDVVMIGAVPHNTIMDRTEKVPVRGKHSYDGYDMKLTYAVSELMTPNIYTIQNPVNSQLGTIPVRDENGRDVVQPPSSAHFILLSHGENRKGAHTSTGAVIDGCLVTSTSLPPAPGFNPGSSGIETELENCDNNDAFFVKSLISKVDNDNYYDDILYFETSNIQTLWSRSFHSPATQTYLYNTNIGNVGIGLSSPAIKLHVDGNIRAESAIHATEFCDTSRTDCVNPEALGGLAMQVCPPGKAATGIQNNDLICDDVSFTSTSFTCPPGEFVTGFSNLGNVECDPVP